MCAKVFHTMHTMQGRNEGGKGGTILGEAESLWGRRMTAGLPKSPNNVTIYFLQYSTFASERPQVRIWGRQTCFLPRAPSNLVTPLTVKANNSFA